MDRNKLRMMVEGGIMIGLATALSMIRLFKMPQGGSVTAGSMIPILLFAMRWGTGRGLVVGTLYGLIQFIMDPFMVSPIQLLLDYPLAFGSLGLAGIARGHLNNAKTRMGWVLGASFLGMLGRAVFHVLSGVVFFSEYAGTMNPWFYAIQYNGSYMGVELVISTILLYLIWNPIQKAAPVPNI
ncbi:MAG: energy-coupled thiamine transporter ThiT [Tissierellia bacterium]|nr:energy-coupled thiamine transporter ThiT [Tissierellia bacterium]